MPDKKPKPFHIGTHVIADNQCLDGKQPVGRVVTAHDIYIYIEWFDPLDGVWVYNPDFTEKEEWYHADDGSPLGEWVPLHEDMFYEDPDDPQPSYGHVFVSLNEVNALLRGEETP